MKTPATQREVRKTTPPAETGELVLKIHGGTWHGRIVRLAALRCTLGSGPQCSLRIRLPGLAPLVCEIDRTAEPAMIRCWAPGVSLNGQICQQALLNIGDRLSLGGMDFEILGGIAAALPWASGLPDQMVKPGKKRVENNTAKNSYPANPATPSNTAKFNTQNPGVASPSLELPTPGLTKQDRLAKKFGKRLEKRRRRASDAEGLESAPQHREPKKLKHQQPLASEFTLNNPLAAQYELTQLPKVRGNSKKSKTPEALREKYLRLREKLRTQQTELEQRTTELTAGQAKLAARQEKLHARRAILETRKNELQATAARLTGETTSLRTQQADLLEQQEQLRTQLQELRAEQAAFHAEQALLQKQREAIQLQQTALQTQQETQRAREEALRAQEEQLRSQQAQLRSELDLAQTRQTQLDQTRSELDRHDQQLRQREDRLTEEHDRLNTELADLHKEQRELATGRQQLLRGHEKFREAQAEHDAAVKSLQQERQTLETARHEVQRARAELALEKQRLQSEYQQQETELLRAKQELELRFQQHAQDSEALAQDQARLTAAKQEHAERDAAWQTERTAWDAKCAALNAEQNRISQQLVAAETNLTEREADLIARETDAATREADVLASQAKLTHELAEVEEERRVLEAATARLTCEQMDLEEARSDFRDHAEELETKLAILAADRANFDAQRTALERLLLDQRDSLAAERINFVRLRDSYLEERSRWQKTKSRTEHDWVQKYHSFEQRESQLQVEGERLRIMLATIAQQEQQLAAAKEDLQQRRQETALAVRSLEEQQSAWTHQQKDWERRESEFIAEQKRLDSCRAAFQTEREKWERQQAAWQDERQKLGRERADIERERKSVQQERADWDRIRASQLAQASLMAELPSPEEIQQRETSLNQQAAELSAWRDQLREQQQAYDTQRAEWQAQFNTAQADLDRINSERAEFQHQSSMLQSERERLEQLQSELDELRRHLHAQRQDNEARAQDVVARESNLLPRELEIRQAGEQLAQREAQLAMERAGYEMQRVKQQELSKALAGQRADLDRRMMPQGEQLEAFERLQNELEQERQTLSQVRGELETLRQNPQATSSSGNEQRFVDLEAELAQVREDLMIQLAANEQERELLARERSELEQARAELQNALPVPVVSAAAEQGETAEYGRETSDPMETEFESDAVAATAADPADEIIETIAVEAESQDDGTSEEAETYADQEQMDNDEDQIFARLRALTSGKPSAEEKPRDPRNSLRESFFNGEESADEDNNEPETAEAAEPVKQHPAVKSYLPTNVGEEEEEDREPLAAPAAARPAPAPAAGEGDDESIDDYMQRLLDRMRGSSAGEGKISNQNEAGKKQHAKDQQLRAEQSLREAADAAPAKPKREYIRTEAPEKKADLAAMRELANSTARTAVQTSRSKVAASQALNKLILGGGGMAVSAVVLMFLGEEETLFQMLAGGAMLLSLLWLAYGMYISRGMLFAKPMRELVLTPPNSTNDSETEIAACEPTTANEKAELIETS